MPRIFSLYLTLHIWTFGFLINSIIGFYYFTSFGFLDFWILVFSLLRQWKIWSPLKLWSFILVSLKSSRWLLFQKDEGPNASKMVITRIILRERFQTNPIFTIFVVSQILWDTNYSHIFIYVPRTIFSSNPAQFLRSGTIRFWFWKSS